MVKEPIQDKAAAEQAARRAERLQAAAQRTFRVGLARVGSHRSFLAGGLGTAAATAADCYCCLLLHLLSTCSPPHYCWLQGTLLQLGAAIGELGRRSGRGGGALGGGSECAASGAAH